MMKEEQPLNEDRVIKKINRLSRKTLAANIIGGTIKALDLIKQAESLMEKFQGNIPIELEETHLLLLFLKAHILENQGYLTHGFKVAKELLITAEKYDNKWGLSLGHKQLGDLYRRSNELDEAFEHYDRSIILLDDVPNDPRGAFSNIGDRFLYLANIHMSATEAAVIKNNAERARKYFTSLEEIHELKPNNPLIEVMWKTGKIFFLSASTRPRDWIKAEDLCKELIQDENTQLQIKFPAMQILCKLLFLELRVANDTRIIDEIKALFSKMVELAQQYGSMAFLVDFYVIQGKLALLTFDFKAARRSLTQARRIAEKHGYHLGAAEISRLQEELEQQLTTWEDLKQKNAPFSERMELARLEDHLKGRLGFRVAKMERLSEGEVPVYTGLQPCLVCKGSAEGFNVYVCPTCNSFYCKACAQAVINLENQCWTCNSPIDTSKLVRYDVFICHSSKDKEIADATCHFLEQSGIKCWIAPRDVSTGSYASSIVDAIKNSKLMVLIFTNNANFSKHVKRELELSVKNNVTIQPIRTEDVEPTPELEYYISSMHWLDALTPPLEEHLSKLAQKVSQLLDVL